MKLIDFDDTARFERLEDTADSDATPLPGDHPVLIEVYRAIDEDHHYHLLRGTKQYRVAKGEELGPWRELEG